MDGQENANRQRGTQANATAITRFAAWAPNPRTIPARSARIGCIVQLEPTGAAGWLRVATGGEVAAWNHGILLDAINGPLFVATQNTKAISIFAVDGTEACTVSDEYTSGGAAL